MDTPCKHCIFATYEGNTQVGCLANRLESFRNNSIEVLEVYDEDKEFFVIKDKFCNMFRNEDWASRQDLSHRDSRGLIKVATQENKLNFSLLVYCDKDTNILNLDKIIEQAEDHEYIKEVHLIQHGFKLPANSYRRPNLWLHYILDSNLPSYATTEKVVKQLKTGSFIKIDTQDTLDFSFADKLNSSVNDSLKPVLFVKLKNGYVTTTELYYFMGGDQYEAFEKRVMLLEDKTIIKDCNQL